MQDSQLTRLSHYINTRFPCDKKNLPTDLHEFWNHREALSIKSRLITCGNRIIVPREMRPEMLQYIQKGHQGKERCLLWARNTVFWPKMMYDVQELIERCIICQEHGKSQAIIGTTQELPPLPWHTLATDIFYWKRMDFLIVTDVFSKYFLLRKLANSTPAAICAELSTIVTELGLPTSLEVTMDHATIPRNSSSFCNVTTSRTTPAALTIQDLMDSLREWSELLRS